MMKFLRNTKEHSRYWRDRKIDWKTAYLDTWQHPHRNMISAVLTTFPWMSLFEIGCGAGANLVNIVMSFKGKTIQLGGSDINEDAIELAKKTLKGAILKVGSGDDVIMSDDSADVVLTDRMLIYVSPKDIDRYMGEIKRIARKRVVLCEFHEPRWWNRKKIRWESGYHAHDFRKLLEKHGFYDTLFYKITEEMWPGDRYPSYIISAKVPQRKWNQ